MDRLQFIQSYLDSHRAQGRMIEDSFIYAYGPYMCMKQEAFEQEVDEMLDISGSLSISKEAKNNLFMMMYIAALFRSIQIDLKKTPEDRTLNLSEIVTKLIKSINMDYQLGDRIDKDHQERLVKLLIDFKKLNSPTYQAKPTTEQSVITAYSPIVPYEEVIRKHDIDYSFDNSTDMRLPENKEIDYASKLIISQMIKRYLKENTNQVGKINFEKILNELLYTYIINIMWYAEENTIALDEPDNIDCMSSLLTKKQYHDGVGAYYYIALLYHYDIPKALYDTQLDFYSELGNFNKNMNLESFITLVDSMASTIIIDPSMESVGELGNLSSVATSNNDKDIYVPLKDSYGYKYSQMNTVKFDLDPMLNYISLHREIKADEGSRRLFLTVIPEDHPITNVTNYEDKIFYQLDNMLCMPYTDASDYSIHVLCLTERISEPYTLTITEFEKDL